MIFKYVTPKIVIENVMKDILEDVEEAGMVKEVLMAAGATKCGTIFMKRSQPQVKRSHCKKRNRFKINNE